MKTVFRVVKYEIQASGSPGVRSGMWAVVRTREDDFAFADDRERANEIKRQLDILNTPPTSL